MLFIKVCMTMWSIPGTWECYLSLVVAPLYHVYRARPFITAPYLIFTANLRDAGPYELRGLWYMGVLSAFYTGTDLLSSTYSCFDFKD